MHPKHGHLVPTPGDWSVGSFFLPVLLFSLFYCLIVNIFVVVSLHCWHFYFKFYSTGDQYQQYELLKEEVGAVG